MLLAIATTVIVAYLIFERPGGVQWKPLPPLPDRAPCTAGQTHDCVGGLASVIVAPASSAPATPRP